MEFSISNVNVNIKKRGNSSILILLDKYPKLFICRINSFFQRHCHHCQHSNSSIKQKELLIFWILIVPSLLCALTHSASLWARKKYTKNGAGSDSIDIPITWIIMIIPIEKKQLCKRNFIASLSNDLVETNWCPFFLDDHDAQRCLLITI